MKPPQDTAYDAIVVGCGISGGWAAKELTERGLRTLVLEAGRHIDPGTRLRRARAAVGAPIPRPGRPQGAGARPAGPAELLRLRRVGLQVLRQRPRESLRDRSRQAVRLVPRPAGGRALDHVGTPGVSLERPRLRGQRAGMASAVDWPIRYADIAPWYDHVERFIGVSGQAGGPGPASRRAVPAADGAALRRAGGAREGPGQVGRRAGAHHRPGGDPHPESQRPGRLPLLRPLRARAASPIPISPASARPCPPRGRTGRLTLRPDSVVASVIYDESRDRATGVRVIDAATMQPLEFRARVDLPLRLDAGVGAAAAQLEDRRGSQPGSGNSSGAAGPEPHGPRLRRRRAAARFPAWRIRPATAGGPTGSISPRFRNVKDRHPDFLRGYGFQGGGRRAAGAAARENGFGPEFKEALFKRALGPWSFSISGWAECLPRRRQLDRAAPDAEGQVGHSRRSGCTAPGAPTSGPLLKDMQVTAAEMLEAAGRDGDPDPRLQQSAGALHSRDGHGADGAGSEDLGAQRLEPGSGT